MFPFAMANVLPRAVVNPTATYIPAEGSLSPTATPSLGRAAYPPSLCGWLGGDALLPAACKTDEKCVYDTAKGIVGCCPSTGSCAKAFFTNCIDSDSPKMTGKGLAILTW
jgi:hypothetical protein